mmetsp:Transcript_11103/g.25607  ORF Transcript_11103/g.25607 Transcript_11103/m.25607 type:complete len:264 (-) Transcript_11103:1039-1830(-)
MPPTGTVAKGSNGLPSLGSNASHRPACLGRTSMVATDGSRNTRGTVTAEPGASSSAALLHTEEGGGGIDPLRGPPMGVVGSAIVICPPPRGEEGTEAVAGVPMLGSSATRRSSPSTTSNAPGRVMASRRCALLRKVYPRIRSTSGHCGLDWIAELSSSNCQPSLLTLRLLICSDADSATVISSAPSSTRESMIIFWPLTSSVERSLNWRAKGLVSLHFKALMHGAKEGWRTTEGPSGTHTPWKLLSRGAATEAPRLRRAAQWA